MKVPPVGNNACDIAAIKISSIDGAIVPFETAHVRPVDVTGLGVHNNAIRKFSTFADDRFQIGAVRVRGEHASCAQIQEEQAARSGFRAALCALGLEAVEDIGLLSFFIQSVHYLFAAYATPGFIV